MIIIKPAQNTDRGAVALITVIVLGSLLLILGLSASYVGQTEIIIAGQMDRGQHARTLAATCIEEALHRLKLDDAYAGGTIDIDSDSCAVTIIGAGSSRTITSTAISGDFTKNIEVIASLRQNADTDASAWNIDSWTELDP